MFLDSSNSRELRAEMVAKKKSKKATSELESQMTSAKEMLNEDFYEANQILKDNEGLLPLNSKTLLNYL